MMKDVASNLACTLAVLLAAVLLAAGCTQQIAPAEQHVAGGPLPAPPAGWALTETIVADTHDKIEELINGEAGQYYEYDLVRLVRGVYTTPSQEAIVVDVFEMPSPVEAFGVYSQWRDGAEQVQPVGAEGFVADDGAFNFYSGRQFVRVHPEGYEPSLAPQARTLAVAVAGVVEGPAAEIPHMRALPTDNILPLSRRYVLRNYRGHEALVNVAVARYEQSGSRYEVFAAALDSPAAAIAAMEQIAREIPDAAHSDSPRPTLTHSNEFDGEVTIIRSGRYIVGSTQNRAGVARRLAAVVAKMR